MEHFKLRDGNTIPALGIGTFLWPSEEPELIEKAVYNSVGRLGYRHIDCGQIYGNEELVGRALCKAMRDFAIDRSEIFVCTKLWNEYHHPKDVEPAVKSSLVKLGLDYLDLLLMHWPMSFKRQNLTEHVPTLESCREYDLTPPIETWTSMEALVSSGIVKSIGLSNFNESQIKEILAVGGQPQVIQIESHPLLAQDQILEFCRKNEIQMVAYSPLGSSSRPWACPREVPLVNNPDVCSIAKSHGKTGAQVLLKWNIQRGVAVIPRCLQENHAKSNRQIFDFSLNDSDMAAISRLNKGVQLFQPLIGGKPWCFDHPYYPY